MLVLYRMRPATPSLLAHLQWGAFDTALAFLASDHIDILQIPCPTRSQSMNQKLVAKRGYRGCLVISHVEDGVELHDLQYVMDLLGEMQ